MPQPNQINGLKRYLQITFLLLVVTGFLSLCGLYIYLFTPEPPPEQALARILRTGKITVLTRNNANSYYLYRGQPMGFEYDLAKAFADHLGPPGPEGSRTLGGHDPGHSDR